jgi:hypothetical protein
VIAFVLVILAIIVVYAIVKAIGYTAPERPRGKAAGDVAFDHLMHLQSGIIDVGGQSSGTNSPGFDLSHHHGAHTHHADPGIIHHQPPPAPDPSHYTPPPDTSSGHHGHH